MKKVIYPLIVSVILLSGCSKSSPPGEMTDPVDDNPMPQNVTYEDDIKGILQSNCLSCHGSPPTNNAPMSLTTYAQVKNAVENRGLLARINSTTNPMPPTGQLPGGTRRIISDWIDLGMPEN